MPRFATGWPPPFTRHGSTSIAWWSWPISRPVLDGLSVFDDLIIDAVGAGYTLVFNSIGTGPIESVAFDIIAGAPDHLAFVIQPGDTGIGETIDPPVAVEVRDALGNRVDWDNATEVVITISGGTAGAILSGGGPVTVSGGLAVFDALSIDQAGTHYQLNAADGSEALDPIVSSPFDIAVDRIFSDRFESEM